MWDVTIESQMNVHDVDLVSYINPSGNSSAEGREKDYISAH